MDTQNERGLADFTRALFAAQRTIERAHEALHEADAHLAKLDQVLTDARLAGQFTEDATTETESLVAAEDALERATHELNAAGAFLTQVS